MSLAEPLANTLTGRILTTTSPLAGRRGQPRSNLRRGWCHVRHPPISQRAAPI